MGMKISVVIDLALITLALIGVVCLYQKHAEKRQLEKERVGLNSTYGEFSTRHKPQIIRLETNDPMTFQWRVYLPAGYTGVVTNSSSRRINPPKLGHGMPWNHPAEFLITQTFRVRSNYRSHTKYLDSSIQCINWGLEQGSPADFISGGGSGGPIHRSVHLDFLLERWEEFEFEVQEASGQPVEFENRINLLKVFIPDQLAAEYKESTDRNIGRKLVDHVLEIECVTK